jgi:hypothetical protein
MNGKRGMHVILVAKPEGKRLLRRPRRRWFDNIKMELKLTGWLVWTGLIWLRIGTTDGLLKARQ